MIEQNPYLSTFLENSRKIKQEIANNSELIKLIESKLIIRDAHRGFYSETSWDKDTFIPLIPGQYGLKKRRIEEGIIEVTVHADLYKPDLPISPFIVIYGEKDGNLVYIVKDFGDIGDHSIERFLPAQDAIRYMIGRGYGTREDSDLQDPETVDYFSENEDNLWENIFLYDFNEKWAMVDLDCFSPLVNSVEILDGANFGEGRFARLHKIWKIMNSSEYRLV